MLPIPLCEPNLSGNEWQYVKESLDSNWLSGGSFLKKFEESVAEYTGATYAVGISSGTTALHIALLLAGVQPNDLVITTNLSFVATANAIKYTGADPIFLDIDPETWLLDIKLLAEFLKKQCYAEGQSCFHKATNRRISAVVPVHILGNMPDMNELAEIARLYHLALVEDAAESLGSFYKGQHSGTFGEAGTLSFNSNKIITTAGGGMLLANNEQAAKRAKHLITQAKSSTLEYLHDEVGYNYRLVNPLAAIGLAQMEQLPGFVEKKKEIAGLYTQQLAVLPEIKFQKITPDVNSNYWHFVISVKNSRELIQFLATHSIETRPLWIPLNELPPYRNDLYISNENHTQQVAYQGVMLPCSTSITLEQITFVCEKIIEFYP